MTQCLGPSLYSSVDELDLSILFQDVMVVGEPSLMGGEFGEEDERLISRLENSQYDPAAAAAQHAAAVQVGA